MQKVSRLVLLVVASVSFIAGLFGAIIFFPDENNPSIKAHGAETSHIAWQTSLAAASAQAKAEHKYILADVYTDWCGWCKRLDKDVFAKPKVVSYLQKNFICVKVNAEDPKEGQTVASRYRVDGFPCALVFSPEGKLLDRIPGYEGPDDYINSLDEITNGGGSASSPGGSGGDGAGRSGSEQPAQPE